MANKFSNNINEDFVQAVWQHLWFDIKELKTTDGKPIQIIKTGHLNRNSGPDFSEAMIEIDGIKWAGNVEIHTKSSDWKVHGHQRDTAYNNVILHVVLYHDIDIQTANNNTIPVLELYNRINPSLIEKYKYLIAQEQSIPCKDLVYKVPELERTQWLERLISERLEYKSRGIFTLLAQTQSHWEQVFYIILASNFGFHVNKQPFEQLAFNLPLSILGKHKNNKLQIECLVFGVAGLLDESIIEDEYYNTLQKEFIHLKNKYQLKPMDASQWRFMRTRPSNFPSIRLAQFADLIYKSSHLFSKILEIKNIKTLYTLFDVEANEYWKSHFKFGDSANNSQTNLGSQAADIIIINTVAPILFAYGKYKNEQQYIDRALDFLVQLKSEKNSIITVWEKYGIKAAHASDSQALLHLKNVYCDYKKCMNCSWGRLFIKNSPQ